MGIRGWYLDDNNTSGRELSGRRPAGRMVNSSYTDLTMSGGVLTDSNYTEFNMTGMPVTDSEFTDFTAGAAVQPETRIARKPKAEKKPVKAKTTKAAKTKQKRKLSAKGKLVVGTFVALLGIGGAVAGSFCYLENQKEHAHVKKEVILEAGSQIQIQDFFSDCPLDAKFVTDISGIDTNIPAIYELTVFYEKAFTENVTLKIEDHTGPEGKAIAQTVYTTCRVPDAADCVCELYDLSGIAKVAYQDKAPTFTAEGSFSVPVIVTDMYGNETKIKVPFTVFDDRTAPIIEGVHDIEIEGDTSRINLLEGITAYDDYDLEPIVRVNDSTVNYEKSGSYELTYSAIDKAGNISSLKATLKITLHEVTATTTTADNDSSSGSSGSASSSSSSSSSDSSSDPAYDLAEKVMSTLWRSNDVDTARAIFNWVHSHISYQTVTTWQSYEDAAYRGFSRHNGDCYVYFCCAKMLLDCAGIPNLMVERYPVYSNGHYWNLVQLNGEWYHCDATVFKDHPSMYFMCTDDEIDDSHHQFNGSLYPERAGGSTDYLNQTTPEPTATPTPTDTPTPTPAQTSEPQNTEPDPSIQSGEDYTDPIGEEPDSGANPNEPIVIPGDGGDTGFDVVNEPVYGGVATSDTAYSAEDWA